MSRREKILEFVAVVLGCLGSGLVGAMIAASWLTVPDAPPMATGPKSPTSPSPTPYVYIMPTATGKTPWYEEIVMACQWCNRSIHIPTECPVCKRLVSVEFKSTEE